mmetsp:Transcript_12859/g.39555  ORF Transcript_12859/g.39555 Transcript_12859/m.39555 type:complete len:309 (+) Transcript_12859:365-1291(+)
MKAWVREASGGIDTYQWKDIDPVEPGEGEVQLKVISSSINPIDYKRRLYGLETLGGKADEFPVVDGYDVCGEVLKCGPGTTFKPGDIVFGDINDNSLTPQRFGTWAARVTAKESTLSKLRDGMDPIAAGGIGLVFGTFLQSLEECGVQNPKRILILGGAGGAGSAALQISKQMLKAERVVTTASEKKFDFVKEMGADDVVNYREKDFTEALANEKFDFIFDTTGEAKKAVSLLAEGGIISTITVFEEGEKYKPCLFKAKSKYTDKVAPYFQDGTMKVPMQVFKASELPKAMELSESGRATGKIILDFS